MFYTTNKLRHSTYPCTPSGKQNQGFRLDFARFIRSSSFFSIPLKRAVKNFISLNKAKFKTMKL